MSYQDSLTEEEIEIIQGILKKHNIETQYMGNDGDTYKNDISIMISEDDKDLWYIQVN